MSRMSLMIGVTLVLAAVGYAAVYRTYRALKLGALEPKALTAPIEWAGDPDAPCTLLMVGDSRIAEWPLEDRPGWRVGRLGFPGEAAINIEPGVRDAIAGAKPTVAVVQAGANDATAAVFQNASERERTTERAADAVLAIAEVARRAGATQVFVLTVVPPIESALWKRALVGSAQAPIMAAISDRIAARAGGRGFWTLDADRLFRDGEGLLRRDFRRNDLHWSTAAYRALNAALWADVTPCRRAC
jgi:hypothetical protein